MKSSRLLLGAGLACLAGNLAASPVDVALNKPVTLSNPADFFTGGWGSGLIVSPSTVVDGFFLPETTQWDQGSVWWNPTTGGGSQYLDIDLQGTFTIKGLIVQADDNDTYRVQYWDSASSQWLTAWDVPAVPSYGLVTREDNLTTPITTTALRFSATGGDQDYAVSEIQAFETPVPDGGATALLLGLGLCGMGWLRRKL